MSTFASRYGPWGVVAGGSEGLGAAWSWGLAKRGLDLLLVARRVEPAEALAGEIRSRTGVRVEVCVADLSRPEAPHQLRTQMADHDVGLFIYNAALAPGGPFAELEADVLSRTLHTNVITPSHLIHELLPGLLERPRAGVILVSSLAGFVGSAQLATYSATKAYLRVLAEALYEEYRSLGLDILTVTPGAITTPGLSSRSTKPIPGQLAPARVVESALTRLGTGPLVIPGLTNQIAAALLGRLLPTKAATAMMRRSSAGIATGS
ncbi:MAG: SDR family NAD(P)-dependent oxidoreductase [Acidimicrobiales bacterium]